MEIEHDSKTVKKSWYNHLEKELTVEFQTGIRYLYKDVDEDSWNKFISEVPTGKALNEHIKNKFIYEKLNN